MTNASLCALGGLTPLPVMSAIKHFPEDFGLWEATWQDRLNALDLINC